MSSQGQGKIPRKLRLALCRIYQKYEKNKCKYEKKSFNN